MGGFDLVLVASACIDSTVVHCHRLNEQVGHIYFFICELMYGDLEENMVCCITLHEYSEEVVMGKVEGGFSRVKRRLIKREKKIVRLINLTWLSGSHCVVLFSFCRQLSSRGCPGLTVISGASSSSPLARSRSEAHTEKHIWCHAHAIVYCKCNIVI